VIRKAPLARFFYVQKVFKKVWYFGDGKVYAKCDEADVQRILALPATTIQLVMTESTTGKKWWQFLGSYWVENEDYAPLELAALIRDKETRRLAKLQRAMVKMHPEASPLSPPGRSPIPDAVKQFVWRRDGGCCVKCGGRERLEYDHIIPVAKGGSSTARNLQLLCENCNRSKGANIV